MHRLIWKKHRADFAFAVLAVLAVLLLVAKCRYGFGYYDESFYLTTAQRFWQGDAPVAQEWNLAQFFALFTAPLVGLVEWLQGGTDGIILTFRYLYVAAQALAAVFLYWRLRRLAPLGAALAAVAFLLFAPYNISALSYNSLGIFFLTLAGTIVVTMQHHQTAQTAAAGVLFAAAVLCCPFLTVGYILLLILWLRHRTLPTSFFAPFTAGIAALAVVFLTIVFTRTGPILFLKGLKTMLQSTDRSSESFGAGLLFCTPAAPVLFALLAVLAVVCWRDRSRREHGAWYLLLSGLLAIGFQISFWLDSPYINFFMFSINLCAPFAVATAGQETDRRLLRWLWAPGMIYAFAISLASNQKFYAISSASTVAAVASIVLLARAFAALWHQRQQNPARGALVVLALVLAVQLGSEAVMRWYGVFWQEEPAKLTVLLEEGPEAGIYTDAELAAEYNTMLADIELLRTLGKEQHVLFVSRHSWLYLASPARVGGFSTWMQLNDGIREKSKDQLGLYYDRMPEKQPDAVFVESKYPDVVEFFCGRYDYTVTETSSGWILMKA